MSSLFARVDLSGLWKLLDVSGAACGLTIATWAAFFGSDADAENAGDVAMLANEVTAVLAQLWLRSITT